MPRDPLSRTPFGSNLDSDILPLWEDGDRAFCRAWRGQIQGDQQKYGASGSDFYNHAVTFFNRPTNPWGGNPQGSMPPPPPQLRAAAVMLAEAAPALPKFAPNRMR